MDTADNGQHGHEADLPEIVSREDLYALVWSEPMTRLARRFGLSDVGLAKACARMMVPVPGRGYWAKKEVGRSPRPTRLPTLPANVGQDKRELRVRRREAPRAADAALEEPVAITVVVEEVLTDPHPLVAKSIKALRGGRTSHDGYLRPKTADCLNVEASMGCIDRAMRLYDAVIKAIEDRGHAVEIQKYKREGYEQPQYRTAVLIDGENIELSVSETTKRIERPRTSPEQRPTYELVPSGRLALSIQNQSLGRRFRWSDDGKRTLDSQLGAAIHGLAVAAVEIKAQKAAHAEYQRQQLEAQRRAWEEADRKRAEAGRVRALNAEIDRMHSVRWVRDYLEKLKASLAANPESDTTEMRTWIEWVEAYAERIDPFIPYAVVPKDPNPYG